MREILKDPEAVFELAADLPSGNRMMGTVGPMIGNKLSSAITFSRSPPSAEDIAVAHHVVNEALGKKSKIAMVSNSPEERAKSIAALRKFMGGGQG